MKLTRFFSAALLAIVTSFGVVGCEEKNNLEKAGDAIDEDVDESEQIVDDADQH